MFLISAADLHNGRAFQEGFQRSLFLIGYQGTYAPRSTVELTKLTCYILHAWPSVWRVYDALGLDHAPLGYVKCYTAQLRFWPKRSQDFLQDFFWEGKLSMHATRTCVHWYTHYDFYEILNIFKDKKHQIHLIMLYFIIVLYRYSIVQ